MVVTDTYRACARTPDTRNALRVGAEPLAVSREAVTRDDEEELSAWELKELELAEMRRPRLTEVMRLLREQDRERRREADEAECAGKSDGRNCCECRWLRAR